MNRVSRWIILCIAQGGFSGKFPVAPGTAGTLAGVLIFFLVKDLPPLPYLGLCMLICLIGTWAAGRAEALLGSTDNPSIVIDEIAGFLITLFLVPSGWGFIAAGFVLFRIFDIAKPWPLNGLQEVRGGLGVMLDDIGAGVYANLVLQVAVHLLNR